MKHKSSFINAIIIILALCALTGGNAYAAGTTTQTIDTVGAGGSAVWEVAFTADASAATVPDTTMTAAIFDRVKGMYLYQVITNPGSTAPSDNWDAVVLNGDSVADVLGSQCLNRDTSSSETCFPLNYYLVDAPLTVAISGNSVNSATGTVKIFFVK